MFPESVKNSYLERALLSEQHGEKWARELVAPLQPLWSDMMSREHAGAPWGVAATEPPAASCPPAAVREGRRHPNRCVP